MEQIDKIYVLVHQVYEKQRYDRLVAHFAAVGMPAEKLFFGSACWGSELKASEVFAVWDPFIRAGVPAVVPLHNDVVEPICNAL